MRSIEANLASNVFTAAGQVANSDPSRPKLYWTWAPGHDWFGRSVPGSRPAFENPYNIYRTAPLDPKYRYVLKGHRNAPFPVQQTYEILDVLPGIGGMGRPLAALSIDELEIEEDASFSITINSDPPNGRRNHLQLARNAKALLARDTLKDWAREQPANLSIVRTDAESKVETSERDLAEQLARILPDFIKTYLNYRDMLDKGPVNVASQAFNRGWGLVSAGRFVLREEEALVITVDPLAADYFSLQACGPWLGRIIISVIFHRIGIVAGAEPPVPTEKTAAARNGERHHNALALGQCRTRPRLPYLAHELVAGNVAGLYRRDNAVIQMRIRAADGGGYYLDDGIARIDDFGVGHGIDAHIPRSMIAKRTHQVASSSFLRLADVAVSPFSISILNHRRSRHPCWTRSRCSSHATA